MIPLLRPKKIEPLASVGRRIQKESLALRFEQSLMRSIRNWAPNEVFLPLYEYSIRFVPRGVRCLLAVETLSYPQIDQIIGFAMNLGVWSTSSEKSCGVSSENLQLARD